MAERFSSEYPEEFEKILVNCGAKEQDFPKVYRIAYEGNDADPPLDAESVTACGTQCRRSEK